MTKLRATKPATPPPPPTPAPSPTKKGSCAIGGVPTAGASSLLALTALAVAFLRRRRR